MINQKDLEVQLANAKLEQQAALSAQVWVGICVDVLMDKVNMNWAHQIGIGKFNSLTYFWMKCVNHDIFLP